MFAKFMATEARTLKPTLLEAERAVRGLFGRTVKELSIGLTEDGVEALIASTVEPTGVCVSVLCTGEEEFTLIDPSKSPGLIECVVGWNRATLTEDAVIHSIDQVLLAVRVYCESGRREPTLPWRRTLERYERMERGEIPVQKP